MTIAILGAGALGCTVGAALTEAGHDTWLIGRPGGHLAALRRDGLRLDDASGSRTIPVRATADAAEVGVADLVIVLVKSFQTQDAMRATRTLVGPATAVLSLQNGLGHEDLLAAVIGREPVLLGSTLVGGVLLGPGHVRGETTGRQTWVGEVEGPRTPRTHAVAALLNSAGLATSVSDDMAATRWEKLLVNVATGAVAGITGLTYGQLADQPLLLATASDAVAEAIAVAAATGVRLSTNDPDWVWGQATVGLPASFKTSMLQSLERGRPTEIDVINGAVVRLGKRHGVPTPVNSTLVALVKGLERANSDKRRETVA
ncbi:MAG: ketopantoate reductase family protein [Micropruina sp.]|uniref:ketopantoate reductase family protein n=1 Tax=Micropruina sp. TaxID=2737536 RepID=UPI0039E4C68D